MNTVTPHNVRTVNTTVGELEPGTIYHDDAAGAWVMRNDEASEDEPLATTLLDGSTHYDYLDCKVIEIADSVTIGPKIN